MNIILALFAMTSVMGNYNLVERTPVTTIEECLQKAFEINKDENNPYWAVCLPEPKPGLPV